MYCYPPSKFGYEWHNPNAHNKSDPFSIWDQNCNFDIACGWPKPLPGVPLPEDDTFRTRAHFAASNITLLGETWFLDDPPLDIIIQVKPTHLNRYTEELQIPTVSYMSIHNLAFNDSYLKEKSVCQPSHSYRWGFSSLLLLVFCILTLIFAITLSTLHGDAFWNSKTDRFRYDINHYKDAVDLVRELDHRQLGASVWSLSAGELVQEVNVKSRDISLEIDEFSPLTRKQEWKEHQQGRREERKQAKKEEERQRALMYPPSGTSGTQLLAQAVRRICDGE